MVELHQVLDLLNDPERHEEHARQDNQVTRDEVFSMLAFGYWMLATNGHWAENWERAIEFYAKTIHADSNAPELGAKLHSGISQKLLACGKMDAALDEARAPVNLAPRSLNMRSMLGTTLDVKMSYEDAIVVWEQAIQMAEQNGASDIQDSELPNAMIATLYKNLGYTYFHKAMKSRKPYNWQNASNSLVKSFELDQSNLDVLIYIAESKWQTGEKEGAIRDLYRVLELDPHSWKAYHTLAGMLRKSLRLTAINRLMKSMPYDTMVRLEFEIVANPKRK